MIVCKLITFVSCIEIASCVEFNTKSQTIGPLYGEGSWLSFANQLGDITLDNGYPWRNSLLPASIAENETWFGADEDAVPTVTSVGKNRLLLQYGQVKTQTASGDLVNVPGLVVDVWSAGERDLPGNHEHGGYYFGPRATFRGRMATTDKGYILLTQFPVPYFLGGGARPRHVHMFLHKMPPTDQSLQSSYLPSCSVEGTSDFGCYYRNQDAIPNKVLITQVYFPDNSLDYLKTATKPLLCVDSNLQVSEASEDLSHKLPGLSCNANSVTDEMEVVFPILQSPAVKARTVVVKFDIIVDYKTVQDLLLAEDVTGGSGEKSKETRKRKRQNKRRSANKGKHKRKSSGKRRKSTSKSRRQRRKR